MIAFQILFAKLVCNIMSYFVKLIVEPISVLLEDKGGKTSTEGHNQDVLLFFKRTDSKMRTGQEPKEPNNRRLLP